MRKTAIFLLCLIFSTNSFSQDYYDSDDGSLFVTIMSYLFGYVIIGNYSAEDHLQNLYTPYPYFDGNSGNYTDSEYKRKNCARFSFENGFYLPLTQNAYANRLKGKVNFRHIGFQGDWLQMRDFSENESLALFNLSFCYDRLRFQQFNAGWNMGANFAGASVNKFGFSIGMDAEAFLFNPISIYASAKWSWINYEPLHQYEIRAKLYKKRYFFSSGFESIRVATSRYDYIAVGGGVYF